jgi:ABC-type branched-subunit amino acid transport system substrate-binding protein
VALLPSRRSTSPFRWLALLAVLMLVAAACGDDDDDDATTDTSAAETAPATEATETSAAETTAATEPTETTTGDTEPAEPAGPPAETDGFDGTTISVGYLTDQSGPIAVIGGPLLAGAQLWFDQVNAEGGIAGQYPVAVVPGDTRDDAATAVQEYQRVKDQVVLFANILSTPPTQAVLEFLRQDEILTVPGSLLSDWTREPNLLPVGAPYEVEMINLADWYVNEQGSADDVFCAVAIDDLYGEGSLRGVEFAAEQLGFELAETVTIARGDNDFTAQLGTLEGAGCQVVFAATLPVEQNAMLGQAGDFQPTWLGALPSFISLLANDELYANFYVAVDSPAFADTASAAGMQPFLDAIGTAGEDPNAFLLAGWIQAQAVTLVLEQAVANGDLSRAGILAAATELGVQDFEGLTGPYEYGPADTRRPSTQSQIITIDTSQPGAVTGVATVDSDAAGAYVEEL